MIVKGIDWIAREVDHFLLYGSVNPYENMIKHIAKYQLVIWQAFSSLFLTLQKGMA
jgi:hypothetical protein